MSDIPQYIKLLKSYFKRKKTSQTKVADRLDVDRTTVWRYLNEQVPPADKLLVLTEILGLSQTETEELFRAAGYGEAADALRNKSTQEIASVPLIEKPVSAATFEGRDEEIDGFVSELKPGQVYNVYGLRGMGKTSFIAAVIDQLNSSKRLLEIFPQGVIYENFKGNNSVEVVAQKIVQSATSVCERDIVEHAQRVIAQKNYLVILDEVVNPYEALKPLWGKPGGCTFIFISDQRIGGLGIEIPIGALTLSEAISVIERVTRNIPQKRETVQRLCTIVNCWPLAIRLIGGELGVNKRTAEELLQHFNKDLLGTLDRLALAVHEDLPSKIVQQVVSSLSELAQHTLSVAGQLALLPFSQDSIVIALDQPETRVYAALNELLNIGLIERQNEHYQLTSIAHDYAHKHCPFPYDNIIARLANYFTDLLSKSLGDHEQLYYARGHTLMLLQQYKSHSLREPLLNLTEAVHGYLCSIGDTTDIGSVINTALALVALIPNNENSNKTEAVWLQRLGNFYDLCNDMMQAVTAYERALLAAQRSQAKQLIGAILRNLFVSYFQNNELERAEGFLVESKKIAHETEDVSAEITCLIHEGNLLYKKNDFAASVRQHSAALELAQTGKNKAGEQSAAAALAFIYHEQGEDEKALQYNRHAESIAHQQKDFINEGKNLHNRAKIHRDNQEIAEAEKCYKRLVEIARICKNPPLLSGYLEVHARMLRILGHTDDADKCSLESNKIVNNLVNNHCQIGPLLDAERICHNLGYKEQEKIYRSQIEQILISLDSRFDERNFSDSPFKSPFGNDELGQLFGLMTQGTRYRLTWKMETAVQCYQQALPLARGFYDFNREGLILRWLGDIYKFLGDPKSALKYYEEALSIARETKNRRFEGICLCKIGNIDALCGEVASAEKNYESALSIAKEVEHKSEQSRALIGLGSIYRDTGKYQEAQNPLQEAWGIAEELGDHRLEISALCEIGGLHYRLGTYEHSKKNYSSALAKAVKFGDVLDEAKAYNGLGNAASHLGTIEEARKYYLQVLNIASTIGNPELEFVAHHNLGTLLQKQNRWQDSLSYFGDALATATRIGYRRGEGFTLWCLGDAYFKLRDIKAARHSWNQALGIFSAIKSPIADTIQERLGSLPDSE